MDMKLSPEQQKLRSAARELAEAQFAAKAAEIDRTEAYPYDNCRRAEGRGLHGLHDPDILWRPGRQLFRGRADHRGNGAGVRRDGTHYGRGQHGRDLRGDAVRHREAETTGCRSRAVGRQTRDLHHRAGSRIGSDRDDDACGRAGNTYVVRGKKHWITGGGVSKLHLIFARVFDERGHEQGIGGFLAVRGAPGLVIGKREPAMGLRGIPETEIIFENLEIPEDMLVLPPRGLRRGFADLIDAYNSQRRAGRRQRSRLGWRRVRTRRPWLS